MLATTLCSLNLYLDIFIETLRVHW